jgi:hypothetical protein
MVAMPLLSVTASEIEMAPLTTEKLTNSELTGFPFASRTAASMVLMLMPSAERLDGFAVRLSAATGPAMKLTLVESLIPPQVVVMVAEPRLVGLVKVAKAFPLVVLALKVLWVPAVALSISPAVVVKLTGVPSPILLPSVSSTVAVIRVFEVPLATISALPAVTVTEPTEPAPPPALPIKASVIGEAEVTPPAEALIVIVSAAELMSVTSQFTVPSAPVEEVSGSIATRPEFPDAEKVTDCWLNG